MFFTWVPGILLGIALWSHGTGAQIQTQNKPLVCLNCKPAKTAVTPVKPNSIEWIERTDCENQAQVTNRDPEQRMLRCPTSPCPPFCAMLFLSRLVKLAMLQVYELRTNTSLPIKSSEPSSPYRLKLLKALRKLGGTQKKSIRTKPSQIRLTTYKSQQQHCSCGVQGEPLQTGSPGDVFVLNFIYR